MGWRENGEALIFPFRMWQALRLNDPKQALYRAVKEYGKTGEMAAITEYLRSPNAVGGALERELIAWALEQRADNRRKDGGRPTHGLENFSSALALMFYHFWRTTNRQKGDSDQGHRGEMKDIAASYVIEIFIEFLPIANDDQLHIFWEWIRSGMERPGRLNLSGPKGARELMSRAFGPLLDNVLSHNPPK
jgi:hypothetical protein